MCCFMLQSNKTPLIIILPVRVNMLQSHKNILATMFYHEISVCVHAIIMIMLNLSLILSAELCVGLSAI